MKITRYFCNTDKPLPRELTFAVVADLHARKKPEIMATLLWERPDAVLVPGDLCNALDGSCDAENREGFVFLQRCAARFPTFYALGNHEVGAYFENRRAARRFLPSREAVSPENRRRIAESGAVFVDNAFVDFRGIRIGGLRSGGLPDTPPSTAFLSAERQKDPHFSLLLCHHPEYYPRYLRDLPIDLVVSGHAHGGQIRLFGRGLYATGQGLFPRLTDGFSENRLLISRGVSNTAPFPRLFNPCEVVFVTVTPTGRG